MQLLAHALRLSMPQTFASPQQLAINWPAWLGQADQEGKGSKNHIENCKSETQLNCELARYSFWLVLWNEVERESNGQEQKIWRPHSCILRFVYADFFVVHMARLGAIHLCWGNVLLKYGSKARLEWWGVWGQCMHAWVHFLQGACITLLVT